MTTVKSWHRVFDLDISLDESLVWARKLQLSRPGTQVPGYLGADQMYWEDNLPKKTFDYLDSLIPLMGTYKGQGETWCTLWEYPSPAILPPHIDSMIKLFSTNLILPLIGKFRTSIVEPNTENKLDSVEYGPGQAFFLKSKEFWHMGEPVDDYRLCVLLFIKKEVNLDSYING